MGDDTATRSASLPVAALVVVACAAALGLFWPFIMRPYLFQDDFQILQQSWTWEGTRQGLWQPHNEHCMPLGRLWTFGLVHLAGRQTTLSHLCMLQGPLAVLAGMLLVYSFVRREIGCPRAALVATTLFGVSSTYQQAVWWFAASFSILALDTLLVGLWLAQRWRQCGSWVALAGSVACCALAPAWFASGILAGPLCTLYLLPIFRRHPLKDNHAHPEEGRLNRGCSSVRQRERLRWAARWLVALAPGLGTAAFFAIVLPRAMPAIDRLEHYGGVGLAASLDPVIGLENTARSIVDNLLPGAVGIGSLGWAAPTAVVAGVIAAFVAALVWWWPRLPDPAAIGGRRLIVLGLAMVLLGYWLVYTGRSKWDYKYMTKIAWTRYHLIPQLGLALIVAGGLPGRLGTAALPVEAGRFTPRAAFWMIVFVISCLLLQLPRAAGIAYDSRSAPQTVFTTIEEMDQRCRRHHISAEAAQAALPPLDLRPYFSDVNGWVFLRGSDEPEPLPLTTVREVLTAP
jgi:hypothetical protein